MPYASVASLPPAVRAKLKGAKLRQWMHVWNSAYERHGDESRAFAEAWATVQKAGEVQTKAEVNYRAHPKGAAHCAICTMFREPHSCTAVKGHIVAEGWCDIFARKALGKANSMTDFQLFMPIAKINEKKRTVSGYASTPTKDSDGEIVTLDAIRAALPDYMTYGNIREMHALKAVGVAQEANMDTKGLFLTAKVVDDAAWKKCLERVYKGFSIGGKKLAKEGDEITKLELTEISIVDRPANPDCSIAIAKSEKKAEGTEGHLVKAKPFRTAEQKALAKMAKVVGDLTKGGPPAAHDGLSLPAKTAAENPSPKDNSTENNKAAGDGKACEAHGVVGCEKCAAAKTAAPAVEADVESDKQKRKRAKKEAKKFAKSLSFALTPKAPPTEGDFLTLRKASKDIIAPEDNDYVTKPMGTAGSLAYCFDSLRNAQRQLLGEAKREGGDMKDKDLAKRIGEIAKQLSGVISEKATHEGEEATNLTDADDQYLSTYLGEDFMDKTNTSAIALAATGDPMTDAILSLMKRAAVPTKAARMSMAKDDVDKARKAMKECRKAIAEVHKMCKASYFAKAKKTDKKPNDNDGDEFDHAGAMDKLNKAYQAVDAARTFGKAAIGNIEKAESISARSGQRGQEAGDAEPGFYEVPPGVKDLSPSDLATAAPGTTARGGSPAVYPVDGGVYPGKAAGAIDLRKFADVNGRVPAAIVELVMQKAQSEGELEALRRMPVGGNGRARPFAFDTTRITAGGGSGQQGSDLNKALFTGVNVNAIGSGDEHAHTEATAKAIGNFLTSGHFGKSIMDPSFHGAAGSAR